MIQMKVLLTFFILLVVSFDVLEGRKKYLRRSKTKQTSKSDDVYSNSVGRFPKGLALIEVKNDSF